MVFIHTINSQYKVIIGTSATNLVYITYKDGVAQIEATTLMAFTDVDDLSFAQSTNALMISDSTAETTTVCIFDAGINLYRVFTDLLPDVPIVRFTSLHVTDDDEAGVEFKSSPDVEYGQVELSQYIKMQKEKTDSGYLSGMVLIRCAWELFDGTLVRHTIPHLKSTSIIMPSTAYDSTLFGADAPGFKTTTTFDAVALQYTLACEAEWLTDIQTRYKNIIRSLKIFVTMPKSPEVETVGKTLGEPTFKHKTGIFGTKTQIVRAEYDVQRLAEYVPDKSEQSYFLLKEYKLSELTAQETISLIMTILY